MKKRIQSRRRGFTLIEMLIVVVIAAVLMLIGIPILRGVLIQAQVMGYGSQVQTTFQRARFEAIQKGFPVVVQLLPDEGRMRAYVDVPELDPAGNRTDTPFVLQPAAGLLSSETDRELFEVLIPRAVVLATPGAEPLVDGLTNISGGPPAAADPEELVVVFNPTGSVQDLGAFRFAGDGPYDIFLESRIEFAASGKSVIRKFDCIDSVWRYRDEELPNRKAWEWFDNPGC